MDLLLKIGTRLREIRTSKKLSMSDISLIIFDTKHNGRISNIENGKKGLTIKTLENILNKLDYDLLIVPKDKIDKINEILDQD